MAPWRTRLWTACLLASSLSVATAPARAEIPQAPARTTPADEVTAKRNFDSGLKLYGEGAYAEALVAFEASYRLGGRPSALKNVAQCHRNLKHFVDAHDAYEQLLAAHGPKLVPAERKAVEQALEELSLLTGTVQLNVSAADADVEIDGKTLGRSPLVRPVRTSVGAHRIRVTKAGFEPFEQNVNVGSQEQKTLDATLVVERRTGRVAVREPFGRDVRILIDGEDKGPAPWEGEVGAGEHTVEAKGPLFAADPRKLNVVAKERVEVTVDAQPLTGHLRITTIPASAAIKIDHREAGTGVWEGELPAGPHHVEATLPGQPTQVREIRLGRGQNIVQEIPILGAMGLAKPIDYNGIYIGLSLEPYFLAGGYTTNRASALATTDTDRWAIGGGMTLRGGYSFGWLSAEVIGAVMVEHREERQAVPSTNTSGSADIIDTSTAPNVFLGIGPRVTTKDDLIRFTFGLAPGIAIRNYNFNRNTNFRTAAAGTTTTNPKSEDFSTGYTAFALNAEGGVLLGSTPGTKFFIGAHAWVDFPSEDVIVGPESISALPDTAFRAPNRGILVASSTQFFIGPVIGLRIGR